MCTTGQQPSNVTEALAAVQAGLAYLNGAAVADLPGPVQAECHLAGLAEEMRSRTAAPDGDGPDPGGDEEGFAGRRVRLGLTFRGAGRLEGDLTPACAAALGAVLQALGKKAGPEDGRTPVQRDHDALEEACRRLAGTGWLPGRAGPPTHVQLHLTLDQLRDLPGGRDAESAWRAGQATGDGQPGWLSARAARGYACDAAITPLVTGHLDPAALDALTGAFTGRAQPPLPPATAARLRDTLLRYAADLLSGPGGLAAFLRARLLGGEFPAVSLPLDVGAATPTVPGHLRRAVITRDRHCAFPGCTQPPPACQVHHLRPRADGGPTRLDNLLLLCAFHHLIAVHQWGWDLALHSDGTVTAVSPDGKRTLHSHGPPAPAPPDPLDQRSLIGVSGLS